MLLLARYARSAANIINLSIKDKSRRKSLQVRLMKTVSSKDGGQLCILASAGVIVHPPQTPLQLFSRLS